jgi:hypothetical protein
MDMKKCGGFGRNGCGVDKQVNDFSPSEWSYSNGLCKKCIKEVNKKYNLGYKTTVFNHYSNGNICCACCGEKQIEFLSIDHIDNDGSKHRKELADTLGNPFGAGIYRWLIKNRFPKGFRVLCMNCNFALGHFGYCPHSQFDKK